MRPHIVQTHPEARGWGSHLESDDGDQPPGKQIREKGQEWIQKGKMSIIPVGILSSYHISIKMGTNRESTWSQVGFLGTPSHTGKMATLQLSGLQITWSGVSPHSISTANSWQRLFGQASVGYLLLIQSQVTKGINVTAKELHPDDP